MWFPKKTEEPEKQSVRSENNSQKAKREIKKLPIWP